MSNGAYVDKSDHPLETPHENALPADVVDDLGDAATAQEPIAESNLRNKPLGDADLDSEDAASSTALGDFDVETVANKLLGSWPEERMRGRALAADPRFQRDETLDYRAHRARVLEQLRTLVEVGTPKLAFPTKFGGSANNGGNLAVFQELFLADPSLQIKSGVQFGLFGSAILHLGTESHHDRWLPGVLSLETPGAFAMTETGHGSNVAGLGTTATYDPATEEWVINTPFRLAWKDYLGNAAQDGIAAVVFAQLITRGVNHGVHAFYVPLRDENGEFLPGIGGDDDGVKGGLNGVDNGRLHFDHVRIPRDHLLNRYGDVDAVGEYTSPIASPGRRFFVMTSTLVQGRVSLDGAAAVAQRAALQIGVTYANQRRQFDNAKSGRETVLLDYGRHQHRLIPRIATAFAATFAHDELLNEFDAVFSGEGDTPERRADLETLAAACKALSTWQGMDTLQAVRESCGGAGFLAENRVVSLHHDLDVYTTFEGDNTILLQLVGKRLLEEFAAMFKNADARESARLAVAQAAGRAARDFGWDRLTGNVSDLGNSARSVGWLREPDNQRMLLSARVEDEIERIGTYLSRFAKDSAEAKADALNSRQNRLIAASRAYAELMQWEAFTRALSEFDESSDTYRVLRWLRDLFGLGLIERDLDWYLLSGRLTVKRAKLVRSYVERLISRLRPFAQPLVDAFGYGPEQLRAKIASGVEAQWQHEANEYVEELRASGDLPTPEPRPDRTVAR